MENERELELERLIRRARVEAPVRSGRVHRMVGLTLEAKGIQAPLGAHCVVEAAQNIRVEAEVVGFNDQTTFLMPFTLATGIGPGAVVRVISLAPKARLGDALLGRVIDARGVPLDGRPMPDCDDELNLAGLELNPLMQGSLWGAASAWA